MSNKPRYTAGLLALGLAAAAPAAASAAPVNSGSLTWTQTNVWAFPQTNPPHDRTWLGYLTVPAVPPPFPGPGGGMAPIAPATGDTVDPTSAKGPGIEYSTQFPATSGDYDPLTGVGAIEFDGGLSYTGPSHGIDMSVEKPRIVLNGNSGEFFASGKGETAAFDRSAATFSLDLSNATVVLRADGSRDIGPVAPTLASDGRMPSSYTVGSGPERVPNTFGEFTIKLHTNGPVGPQGAAGPAGPQGARGPAGSNRVVAVLPRAPFKGSGTKRVRLTRPGGRRVLARGTIKRRVMRLTLTAATNNLRGRYRVRSLTKPTRTATVVMPG